MEWSSFQQNIFNFVENSKDSAVINSVAGSGKSSTIVECAKRASQSGNKSILFLAFNKSIANELEKRMKDYGNVECKTLHSHGYRAIMSYKKTRLQLDDNKWFSYLSENLNVLSNAVFEDKSDIRDFISRCMKLFDLCRINLIESNDMKGIDDVAYHYGIFEEYDEYSVVSSLLDIAYVLNDNVIDYVDMVVLPCMNKEIKRCVRKYDLVFVDECQDLSAAQRQLLTNSIKKGGRFISVGDPKQSIVGFAGADCDSFNKMRDLANGKEFPLSVCYRCGKNIIKLAQNIVPNIQAYEGNGDGEVKYVTNLDEVKAGDCILSRKLAPTISLCLRLIAQGRPAKVKGKDMFEGLKKMIEKSKAKSFDSLYDYLEREYNKLVKRIANRGIKEPESSIQAITFRDKIECIKCIAEQCSDFNDLDRKMSNLFTDYEDGRFILLSTIHKAKGLEFDRVFIILPDDLPLCWKGQQEWEKEQEMNLKYVAITRAKKELFFVNMTLEQLLSL